MLLFLYYIAAERNLEVGEGLDEVFIKGEKIAFINLNENKSLDNLTKITFVFYDNSTNESVYETQEFPGNSTAYFKGSFWQWLFKKKIIKEYQYNLSFEDLNLTNYKKIVKADAFFEYKKQEKYQNATPPILNETNRTTGESGGGGWGGGGGGGETSCTASCAGKQCGGDGCGGSCGTCSFGYVCNSTQNCEFVCANDPGCSSEGLFCDDQTPYNCTLGALGCYNRTNLPACGSDEQCTLGQCILIPNCTHDDNCTSLNLLEISTCTNNPDGDPLTYDFAPENVSTCDLGAGSCTQVSYTYTHFCNLSCGAECLVNGDCSPNTCSVTYNDYCSGTFLVEYDNDNLLDSTLVEDSCENNCNSCSCTDCTPDCTAPPTTSHQVPGVCGFGCVDNSDCEMKDCDNLDGCVGDVYYDYNDVREDCQAGVCVDVVCNDYVGYKEDPRCTSEICGNNLIEGDETCDGTNLLGQTCQSQGYDSGLLDCCPECNSFEFSDCESRTYDSCTDTDSGTDYYTYGDVTSEYYVSYGPPCPGDTQRPDTYNVDLIYDVCNGNILSEKYCDSLMSSYVNYDCSLEGKICTSGACVDPAECTIDDDCSITDCDYLDGCQGQDYYDYDDVSGECTDSVCSLGSCTNPTVFTSDPRCYECGNNLIEGDETCDGTNLLGQTCQSQGYDSGTLYCLPDCSDFDTSSCENNDNIISDCMLIMTSGDYIMTGNIHQDQPITCIEIHASDVSIDCQGHSITTSATNNIAGIASLASNSLIENCDITGFGGAEGGMAVYLRDSHNTRVSSNTFNNNNNIGILVDPSNNIIISSNTLNDNPNAGIWVNSGCSGTTIEYNGISNTNGPGIILDDSSSNTLIQYNNIADCNDGVNIQPGCTSTDILYNQIIRANSFGIVGHAGDTRIVDNAISDSKWSIQVSGNGNLIYGNSISGSTSSAITMHANSNSLVERNILNQDNAGIHLAGTNDTVVVRNNTITNGSPTSIGYITIAIVSFGSTGTKIEDNKIDNYDRGIHIQQGNTGIKVYDNVVSNCDFGLLYGTTTPTNNGLTMQGNSFCGNAVDARCHESASINNNACGINEGCDGVCDSCGAGSLSIWVRIKQFFHFIG